MCLSLFFNTVHDKEVWKKRSTESVENECGELLLWPLQLLTENNFVRLEVICLLTGVSAKTLVIQVFLGCITIQSLLILPF